MSRVAFPVRRVHLQQRQRGVRGVARNVPRTVAVRDGKRAGGPILRVGPAAWASFAAYVGRPGR
ncbi:DUF397 domain-containing protein [Streptomyces sp. H51]|uniref:DUF397 domain-containing protein n=1 Tax=Streptomyces sp. H51 TaxID=3111770 RepID=UPI002D7808B2|nr:DUF397 domain-containing protein [Streptomyces sp. H51]